MIRNDRYKSALEKDIQFMLKLVNEAKTFEDLKDVQRHMKTTAKNLKIYISMMDELCRCTEDD